VTNEEAVEEYRLRLVAFAASRAEHVKHKGEVRPMISVGALYFVSLQAKHEESEP
jgi:hypothetical protein